ncbi:MAG: aspartate 1-decarboxylase [Pseudomonadota bacterium]|nr:aspartate 1-decarboxylase [Pseudomonadota bacterium]
MKRIFLNSKIHRAVVTGANLNYVGSISIDGQLLKESNILPFEKVSVVNLNNGQRWETYAIAGKPGSGAIELNGGGARLVSVGDIIIIMTYIEIDEPIPESWRPRLVMLNEENKISEILEMDIHGYSFPRS